MTIARLIVEVEGKMTNLQQELTKAARFATDFQRDISKSLSTDSLLSGLSRNQRSAVTQLLTSMRGQFKTGIHDIREDFTAGFLNEREALSKVRALTRNMVAETRQGMRGIGANQIISAQELERLVGITSTSARVRGGALNSPDAIAAAITRQFSKVDEVYQKNMTDILERRARGKVGEQAAARQGKESAAAFNDAWLKEIDKLDRKFKLPAGVRQKLVEQLKPQGLGLGQAATFDERLIANTEQQIGKLQSRMRATINSAKLDLAEGLIKPHEFEQKSLEAMQRVNRGIVKGRQQLRAAGQNIPEVEQLLTAGLIKIPQKIGDAIKPIGPTAAHTFVKGFSDTYEKEIAQLRFDRFTRKISDAEFKQRGELAAQKFNTGLAAGLAQMRQQGLISDSDFVKITKQFKEQGLLAGETFMSNFLANATSLAESVSGLGQRLTQAITLPLVAAGGGAIKLAGDFEAAENRLELAFGPAAERVRGQLKALQDTVPATSIEIRNFATRVAEVFIPLGGATKEIDKLTKKVKDVGPGMEEGLRVVGDMSLEIIKLTKNLTILNPGVSADRAFNAIINATVGRTTELKKLGVVVNQEIINETAYREGIARTGAVLTASQNAQAAYIAIMQRSALIESAVGRARDTLNLKIEFTKKAFIEAGVAIGQVFLPYAKQLLDNIRTVLIAFRNLDPAVIRNVAVFATFAAAVGPTLFVLGKLAGVIFTVITALIRLRTAATGLSLLAGLARLAGPIGILVSAIAALAGGIYLYKKATDEAVESNAKFTASLEGMTQAQLVAAQTEQLFEASRLNASRARLQQQAMNRAVAEAAEKTQKFGANVPGGFKPNPIFSAQEQQAIDAIDARLGQIRAGLNAIGQQMEKNAKATDDNADFMAKYREEFERFQQMARQESERERLRREREEWRSFVLDVHTAVDNLRTAMRLGRDVTKPLEDVRARLEDVEDRMTKVGKNTDMHNRLEQLKNDLESVIRTAQKFDISGLRAAVSTQITAIDDVLSRAKDAKFNDRMALASEIGENIGEIAALEARINVILRERLGTEKQRLELQRDQIRLQARTTQLQGVRTTITDIMFPGFESRIDEIGAKLKEAKLTLDVGASLPPDQRDKFEREVKSLVARLQRDLAGELSKVLFSDTFKAVSPKQRQELVGAIEAIFKRNDIAAGDFNTTLGRTDRILGRLAIGIRGIREIASIFGDAADEAERIAGATFGLIEGIQQIRAANRAHDERIARDPFAKGGLNLEELGATISGMTALVGSGFAIFRSITDLVMGEAPNREELMSIQRSNNERLAELNFTLKGFTGAIRDQQKVQGVISNSRAIQNSIAFARRFPGATIEAKEFDAHLRKAGSSLDELQAIAKQNGITLLDGKGRVVASALDALSKSIEASIEINTKWQNGANGMIATFADLRASAELFNDVFNVEDTPQNAINQALNEIATLSPKLFETFFKGIDPNDAKAMEEALQKMTRMFLENADGFAKLFGGLLNKEELVSIIQLMAGAFDKLRESTDDLTESMLNVPTWFRVQQTRFEAVTPRLPETPAAASLIDGSSGSQVVTNDVHFNGPVEINVNQQPGESGTQFADDFVSRMRRKAFVETGSSALPGDN